MEKSIYTFAIVMANNFAEETICSTHRTLKSAEYKMKKDHDLTEIGSKIKIVKICETDPLLWLDDHEFKGYDWSKCDDIPTFWR